MSEWVPCKDRLPEKGGDYLVTRKFMNNYCSVDVLGFSNNLYEVDEFDFYDKRNVSGWYYYDEEYGFNQIDSDSIIAWMPLPKPYEEE